MAVRVHITILSVQHSASASEGAVRRGERLRAGNSSCDGTMASLLWKREEGQGCEES